MAVLAYIGTSSHGHCAALDGGIKRNRHYRPVEFCVVSWCRGAVCLVVRIELMFDGVLRWWERMLDQGHITNRSRPTFINGIVSFSTTLILDDKIRDAKLQLP